MLFFVFFFFNDTATTEIYTLSLHDALPICCITRIGFARSSHLVWLNTVIVIYILFVCPIDAYMLHKFEFPLFNRPFGTNLHLLPLTITGQLLPVCRKSTEGCFRRCCKAQRDTGLSFSHAVQIA